VTCSELSRTHADTPGGRGSPACGSLSHCGGWSANAAEKDKARSKRMRFMGLGLGGARPSRRCPAGRT
jgi:hypothetical protein